MSNSKNTRLVSVPTTTQSDSARDVERAAFRARAATELLHQFLLLHNEEFVGMMSVAALADSVELIARELDFITNYAGNLEVAPGFRSSAA